MIAPSARMMLLGAPYAGQRLRKLRFLTTDNNYCVKPRFAGLALNTNVLSWFNVKWRAGVLC